MLDNINTLWYNIHIQNKKGYNYMNIRDDVSLKDIRRYGDLLDRKDWIYNNQNHSIQVWQYGGDVLQVKMVEGQVIYIKEF